MQGILTLAQGDRRYLKMAKFLALSLKKTNPHIKRAIITDAVPEVFKDYYDIIIPCNPIYGKGLEQKFNLDKYTPFDTTLFIDSDCLVIKPLDPLIKQWQQHQFVVLGDQICNGEWYMDIAQMCSKFDLPSIPLFNGGIYFFQRTETTERIYDTSREMLKHYDELGFKRFRGGVNEEPVISVAMARNGVEAIDDTGLGMRTLIGIQGSFNIDVLDQKCRFIKEGVLVEPAIMHFCGAYAQAFHYKRETVKLLLNMQCNLNNGLTRLIAMVYFNIPYASKVFLKRVIKSLLRHEKYNFKELLPVFSNQ